MNFIHPFTNDNVYLMTLNCRESAFSLLVTAAEAVLRWEPDNKDDALRYA